MKYIVYKSRFEIPEMHIFSERIQHSDVADKLGVEPISAGFMTVNLETGEARCRGFSHSLKLDSRGAEDEELFASM